MDSTNVNVNTLQPNNFELSFGKRIPGVIFHCRQITMPAFDLNRINQPTMDIDYGLPSNKLSHTGIVCMFVIDSKMENYEQVLNWMKFTKDNFDKPDVYTDDVSIIINDNNNNRVCELVYHDAWINNLGDVNLATNDEGTEFLCPMTLTFDNFDIRR